MEQKLKPFLKDYLDNLGKFDVDRFIRISSNYNIISFDIFDTLIKRNVPKPIDVFGIVEERCQLKGFKQERVEAEKKARLFLKKDVCLDEIYTFMPKRYSELIDVTKKAEIQAEIDVCTVDAEMKGFYDYCVSKKCVILVTDMYLPQEIITLILKNNGIRGYSKLFLSNELNVTKSEGTMYRYVKKNMNNSHKIIHFGNSFKSDYYKAMTNGIRAIKIPTERKN